MRAEARQVREAGQGDAGQTGPGHSIDQPQLDDIVTTATTTTTHHVDVVERKSGDEEEHQQRWVKMASAGWGGGRGGQCDQIWRNFATLTKKIFGNFEMVWVVFGKIVSLLW